MSPEHPAEGDLRAYLDRGLPGDRQAAVGAHVARCAECVTRLEGLAALAARAGARLSVLDLDPEEVPTAPDQAWARFQAMREAGASTSYRHEVDGKEGFPMLKWLTSPRSRRLAIGTVVVALVVAAFSSQQVRALASQFLSLFRVQKVVVLPVDPGQFEALDNDKALGQTVGRLFSDSVNVIQEPGEPRDVADAAEAGRLAGFPVRLPAEVPSGGRLSVQGGAAFEFTVDRDRAQAVLDSLAASGFGGPAGGAMDGVDGGDGAGSDATALTLPPSIDGARVSVTIPAGVAAHYGPCGDVADHGSVGEEPTEGEVEVMGRRSEACVTLVQVPSPTVVAPPEFDVAALAETGLRVMGFSALEAKAFSRTVDWTSTLVVPIPRGSVTSSEVPVDGVTGSLLREIGAGDQRHRKNYTVLWVKDGIVYVLAGRGDPEGGLAIANSLK